ncbi:MAG: hypothetical protein AAF485_01290 [Chloroflexota bacterium]
MSAATEKAKPGAFRNLSTVSLHKAAQIVGQVVAVFTIPRLLGADDHGHFAFVLSYGYIAQILGDFGTLEVMSRFVPTMTTAESKQLYTRTLVFKVLAGIVFGIIAALVALWLASAWLTLTWAALIGVGVAAHIVAWVPFQFLLGLNRVGPWMIEQSWRQWVLIILLIALYPFFGVGGSLWAWALMELIFCVAGLWWVRHYWDSQELGLDWAYLSPYIRFGFGFFLANLVSAALYRSGPVLVETFLPDQPAQVGYTSLAISVYLMPYLLLTQLALSLVPTLSEFYDQGDHDKLREWTHNFSRYSWLLGWLGTIGVWLAADWGVVFAFGADYSEAATAFKWISLGIPLAGLLWAGNAISTVTGRGSVKFGATLTALVAFVGMAIWLIPLYAATGAAIALTVAITANVIVLLLFLQPDFTLEWLLLAGSGILAIGALWAIERFQLSMIYWGIGLL